ncbi:7TM diverse intracellular signaling domain-containing protein [Winogradskyella maritima]|uniref:histidine kinase n=1 Tax=Winogradskyella maritima TaxID=1517766 RepID=A0ABV8AI99_9FLAO|nr:7TM diverse intracellular signaling domain-containing protein [Winogradskyella maritima]
MKLILLITYVLAGNLLAQNEAFDPEKSKGQLYEYAQYVNTGNHQYSIDDIRSNSILEFKELNSENHSFGFTSDEYWVTFQLKNSSNEKSTYYLETARPITDVVDLFQINGAKIERFRSGDQIDFEDRQVQQRQTVFKLELPANSTLQFYINTTSDGETINMPLTLYSQDEFLNVNYKQQLFMGLFYGLLFLAGLIYLFFYSSLREKTFLYYSLYVFSIGFMQSALDGYIYQYFLPSGGFLNSRMVLITALSSNFFLLKYCEYFLKINVQLKSFKKGYNIAYGIIAVLFAMVFISPRTLELTYPISNVNGLFSLVLILASLFTLRFKKIEIDRYFSIGIFFLVVGLLGFVLNNLSVIPNNFYTLNSAKFGSGFEVIFLSLSMTNLIRKLRENHEHSQELALQKSEEISEMKTFFMSNISHEFRTPINAIMGIVQAEIGNSNNSLEQRKQYEIIKNASVSLLSNVNDVLDFERIEKNQLELNKSYFNPSILLNQISNNWKTEAQNKGLNYSFEMDHEIPTSIYGDPDRFIQIINNILANAVKFTNEGSVKFKLKCLIQPDEMCRFSFQVSDTGIGMDEESKKTLFESFNQMRHNHKRNFGGIGLGLTIVKHLIFLFDGQLKIDSEIGKGTDVFIDIPMKYKKKEVTAPQEVNNEQAYHILVVEDNKMNQLVMRKMLGSVPNVTFVVVNNGQEALDALKTEVYDVILMDLQMPIMDGYEATEKIRSGFLGADIENLPIIAVTADAMQETKQRVFELGMNDYLTKPVDKALLFEKIHQTKYKSKLQIA